MYVWSQSVNLQNKKVARLALYCSPAVELVAKILRIVHLTRQLEKGVGGVDGISAGRVTRRA